MRRPHTGAALAIGIGVAALTAGLAVHPAYAVTAAQDVVVSANPENDTPHVLDGRVSAIAVVGSKVVLGGQFTKAQNWQAGSPVLARSNILAYDYATGTIDTGFAPALNGPVDTLAPGPDGSVFVGGAFSEKDAAGKFIYRNLIKLDTANGSRITAFNPKPSGRVYDVKVRGSKLYAGGLFTAIGGKPRQRIAAVDVTTGAVDANFDLPVTDSRVADLKPSAKPHVIKLDLTPDGSRLVITGNFVKVAGQPRTQIAMIDTTTKPASVSSWATERFTPLCAYKAFDTYMRDIEISPDGSYFVVGTTGGYFKETLCDTASRFETARTGGGQEPTWVDYTGGDTLYSVAVTGEAVYVGGHQRWLNNPFANNAAGPGAVAREGIAALDPLNGMPLRWNPGRTRGVGVFDMVATGSGLLVGSDTDKIGRWEYHARIAEFPTKGGTVVPQVAAATLPAELRIPGGDGSLAKSTYNGSSFTALATVPNGGIPWANTAGAFMAAGRVYYGHSDGKLRSASYDGSGFAASREEPSWVSWANATAMFWDSGRLYYTLSGDANLYYRYFSPESGYVGAEQFVAGSGEWSGVKGMEMAGGKLYYAKTDAKLYRIDMSGGRPTGSATQVSGPGVDGLSWNRPDFFLISPYVG